MTKRIYQVIFSIIFGVLIACANQTTPTGGPKDEIPPTLISSTPPQDQINFKGKKVELTFDELIKLHNAKEEFLITPRIATEYEIKARKNKVIIEFEKALKDSTTYSINFRDGIKDLTEGNPTDTLRIAFSTGTYLDSLSIFGKITRLLTNQPVDDAIVALYDAQDTLTILNSPPLYLTKSNKEGKYRFDNLKRGRYKIYALKDQNKNLILESKSEAYGFKSTVIQLDSTIKDINISIHNLDIRELTLQSSRQSGTTFNIKFNKYIVDYTLKEKDPSIKFHSNFIDIEQNTIRLYKPLDLTDSSMIFISTKDSINNQLLDTVFIKFETTKRLPTEFKSTTTVPKIVTKSPKFEAVIKFTKPIREVNYDSLFLFLDTANIKSFNEEDLKWNYQRDEVTIAYNIDPKLFEASNTTTEEVQTLTSTKPLDRNTPNNKPKERPVRSNELQTTDTTKTVTKKAEIKKPHFYASPHTFISAEYDSSTTIETMLSFIKPEQLGTLFIDVETSANSYIVQLLNSQKKVIAESANSNKFQFNYLEPGTYKLRVLIDTNNNGHWDPGNILENIEPEPVVYYKNSEGNEELTLRANWELGPIVISF